MLNGRRQPSLGRTSRVNREVYARFCERLGAKLPGPTRQRQNREAEKYRWAASTRSTQLDGKNDFVPPTIV